MRARQQQQHVCLRSRATASNWLRPERQSQSMAHSGASGRTGDETETKIKSKLAGLEVASEQFWANNTEWKLRRA